MRAGSEVPHSTVIFNEYVKLDLATAERSGSGG